MSVGVNLKLNERADLDWDDDQKQGTGQRREEIIKQL
jgi:hypothetical protein